jgi:hypothetical protein
LRPGEIETLQCIFSDSESAAAIRGPSGILPEPVSKIGFSGLRRTKCLLNKGSFNQDSTGWCVVTV